MAAWLFRWLQHLNNVKAHVFFQCAFSFFEGFIVNGVINVCIPALETRYHLSSTRSGIIVSANSFAAFAILPFIGYLCERRCKPRVMAAGIFLMALGSFLFALPHFVAGKYTYTKSGNQTQHLNLNSNWTFLSGTIFKGYAKRNVNILLLLLFLLVLLFLADF